MRRADAAAAEILEVAAWQRDTPGLAKTEETEAESSAAFAAVEICAYRMSSVQAAGGQLRTVRTCWLLAFAPLPMKEALPTATAGLTWLAGQAGRRN